MGGRRTEEEDNGLGWTPLSSFILFQFPESGLAVVSLVIIPSSAFRSIASSGPNPQKRCSGRVALQKHTDPTASVTFNPFRLAAANSVKPFQQSSALPRCSVSGCRYPLSYHPHSLSSRIALRSAAELTSLP
jgi:hypothetical protein